MKKIIIATDMWHPQVNGVVKSIEETSRYLKKNGFEVTIIHPWLFYTIPFFFYPGMRITFFSRRLIEKIIKDKKPDYIHISTEGSIGLATRAVCLKKKLNFTTTYHGNIPYYIEHYVKIKSRILFTTAYAYFRWFHNAGNKTMIVSESLKKELEEHGFKDLHLWSPGVDIELFKRNLKLPNGFDIFPHPIFVYFGRVAQEKNVEEFLKCNLPGTKLVIGDGPIKQKLENKYGKSAIFVGWKKGQELVDFLSICDVFVFPSRTDTFALSVVEAFACGLPVAAHDELGQRNLITQGVDGFFDEDLAVAAIKCIQLSREKCREKAMNFTWEKSTDYFMKNLVEVK